MKRTIAVAAFVAVVGGGPAATQVVSTTAIPESIHIEHEHIQAALTAATQHRGAVGQAARELRAVLHPHFVREEQVALPPLGLLARLARGAAITDAEAVEVLAMTDALRHELPSMLEEHVRIRAAVMKLRGAAEAAGARKIIEMTDDLALHARTEEEVLYPAAIVVGDVLRTRVKGRT